MVFSEKLKSLRNEEGISQQELADRIFVSRSAIAKWENGLGLPSEESLQLLCDHFKVKKEELIQSDEPRLIAKNRKIHSYRFALILISALALIFLATSIVGTALVVRYQNKESHQVYESAPILSIDGIAAETKMVTFYRYENGEFALKVAANMGMPFGERVETEIPQLAYKTTYDVKIDTHLPFTVTDVRYSFLNDDYSIRDADPDAPMTQIAYYTADFYNPNTKRLEVSFMENESHIIVLQFICKYPDLVAQYSFLIHR